MMITEELTEIDYCILAYVNKKGSVSLDKIEKKFKQVESLDYRIKVLSTPEYRHSNGNHFPIKNSYCLSQAYNDIRKANGASSMVHLQIYSLTGMGKKVLQDHKYELKRGKKELWLKNAWIPILVSLVTNLVIIGIKQLLPPIIEWLTNSL